MKKYMGKNIITKIILIIFLFLNLSSSVSASQTILLSDQELKTLGFSEYESINPNLLVYPLKKFGEKIILMFIFREDDKKQYFVQLLDTRFREVIYIINLQKTGFLAETVSYYNAFLKNINTKYSNDLGDNLKFRNQIRRYVNILEVLRDKYPANSSYWLNIQQAIDSTRLLLQK